MLLGRGLFAHLRVGVGSLVGLGVDVGGKTGIIAIFVGRSVGRSVGSGEGMGVLVGIEVGTEIVGVLGNGVGVTGVGGVAVIWMMSAASAGCVGGVDSTLSAVTMVLTKRAMRPSARNGSE